MADLRFFPIDPAVGPDGSPAVLRPFLSSDDAGPLAGSKAAPTISELSSMEFVQQELSINAAAQFSSSGIFSTSTTGRSRAMVFDAVMFVDRVAADIANGRAVAATRWGLGFRVNLLVSQLESKFSLTLATIGAAVELGIARAKYEVRTLGIGDQDLFADILSLLPALEDFKPETRTKIGIDLPKLVTAAIKKNANSLKPVVIAVAFRQPPDTIQDAQSVLFAMKCIVRRQSLQDCLRHNALFNPGLIQEVYDRYTDQSDESIAPTRDQARAAKDWIDAQ